MTDVRDGTPFEIEGLPASIMAYRHSDGVVYLWDGRQHACLGSDHNLQGLGAALNNLGHGNCELARRGLAAGNRRRF